MKHIIFLLSFSTLFTSFMGQIDCPNPHDADSDGVITIIDLLDLLAIFGEIDADSDGIWDSVDDCVGTIDDCGECNGDGSACACGDHIFHDGYNYSTIYIGEQCWFAENCRYLPAISSDLSSSSTPYYYVYGYQGADVEEAKATENYATFGVLYNWSAVMEPGICPSGWHIPTDLDWQTLEITLGMSVSVAANSGWRGTDQGFLLKSSFGWPSVGNGSNLSGFTGLPGGFIEVGLHLHNNAYGYWWSSTSSGNSFAWYRRLYYEYDNVGRHDFHRYHGFSARCIKD